MKISPSSPPTRSADRGIARSFQIANIFHRLTVFKNVQVSVLSRQRKSNKLFRPAHRMAVEETNRILESVSLLDSADRIAGSLSHGDQRILEIAIALGNEPQILVLDEPTAGMSPDETAATMALIRGLAETQGLTILFCEHDMDCGLQHGTKHHGDALWKIDHSGESRRNKTKQGGPGSLPRGRRRCLSCRKSTPSSA